MGANDRQTHLEVDPENTKSKSVEILPPTASSFSDLQQQLFQQSAAQMQFFPSPYASVQVVNGGSHSGPELHTNGVCNNQSNMKSVTLIRGSDRRLSDSGISSLACSPGHGTAYATVKRTPTRTPKADRNVYDFPSR